MDNFALKASQRATSLVFMGVVIVFLLGSCNKAPSRSSLGEKGISESVEGGEQGAGKVYSSDVWERALEQFFSSLIYKALKQDNPSAAHLKPVEDVLASSKDWTQYETYLKEDYRPSGSVVSKVDGLIKALQDQTDVYRENSGSTFGKRRKALERIFDLRRSRLLEQTLEEAGVKEDFTILGTILLAIGSEESGADRGVQSESSEMDSIHDDGGQSVTQSSKSNRTSGYIWISILFVIVLLALSFFIYRNFRPAIKDQKESEDRGSQGDVPQSPPNNGSVEKNTEAVDEEGEESHSSKEGNPPPTSMEWSVGESGGDGGMATYFELYFERPAEDGSFRESEGTKEQDGYSFYKLIFKPGSRDGELILLENPARINKLIDLYDIYLLPVSNISYEALMSEAREIFMKKPGEVHKSESGEWRIDPNAKLEVVVR